MNWSHLSRVGGLAVALACAAPVAADPVNVFAGSLVYSRQDLAGIGLVLENGSLSGEFGNGPGESHTPPHACFPCTPGAALDPDVTEDLPLMEPGVPVGVFGQLAHNSVSYDLVGLNFTVQSDPVIVPAFDENGNGTSSIARFTLSGLATGRTPDGASSIGLALLGLGNARVLFTEGAWLATEFTFDDQTPVPEPATMLLVGSGIAAALVRRRRRTL